jgi:chaperonin cofactor prefoldin
MATSWLRPLHAGKGKSIARTLGLRTDYAKNPGKTEGGRLVAGYECAPRSADEEFLLAKKEYETNTGRDQGSHNVIAYHTRMSFKPGEITLRKALEVGYETAYRWTKGKHAFVIGVHTDRAHIHCHIVYNSTALDCSRKFRNFWNSSFALRRLSDLICAEHGLSVIKNPKPSKGRDYGEWLGYNKPLSHKETVKRKIDEIVPFFATFEDFLARLRADGFEVSANRKHISVKAPGREKNLRLDTLKGDYTEAAIRARLGKEKVIASGGDSGDKIRAVPAAGRVSLLVDIQAKIREGKGEGYRQWATIFNLKQAAKTLIFLQENGIDSYDDLKKKSSSASGDFATLTKRIKEIETRLKEVTELQKYIGQYGKTRDVYAKYKASGWSRDFYDVHAADIILHQAAKKYFDELGMKKLPSINQLKQEYATLAVEKKKLYGGYHEIKDLSRELLTARTNAERILGMTPDAQNRDASRGQTKRDSHEI